MVVSLQNSPRLSIIGASPRANSCLHSASYSAARDECGQCDTRCTSSFVCSLDVMVHLLLVTCRLFQWLAFLVWRATIPFEITRILTIVDEVFPIMSYVSYACLNKARDGEKLKRAAFPPRLFSFPSAGFCVGIIHMYGECIVVFTEPSCSSLNAGSAWTLEVVPDVARAISFPTQGPVDPVVQLINLGILQHSHASL